MRFLSQIHKKDQERATGFTLVEILIIAPIVILVISGFVALMVTMVGDALVTSTQNSLTFSTQDALDRIEQDTRLTTQFLSTTTSLTAPQGSDNNYTGTAPFTSSNALILGYLTTDQNPANSSRQLIYYANQPNNCGSLQTYNRVFQGKVIYFVNNGTLWRRTIIPGYDMNAVVDDGTVCSAPWQRNSCSAGYTAALCQTNDVDVMDNVASFSVQYLSSPGSTANLGSANALSANAIAVILQGQIASLGRNITSSATLRATKLNSINVDPPIPAVPAVTATAGSTSVNFSWAAVPNATSYAISYNINGGTWTNAINDNRTTTFNVPAGGGDSVTMHVYARNSTGSSNYGSAVGSLPRWNACTLQNGWSYYGYGYNTPGYTRTRDGVVVLKGLIQGGTATSGTILCVLPVGFRPSSREIFMTTTSGGTQGGPSRIDILPTGEVQLVAANSGWISFDNINFVDATAGYTWNNLTLQNSWVNYGSPYSNLQTVTDATGRIHVQGLIKNGIGTDGTNIASYPSSEAPSQFLDFPASSDVSFNSFGVTSPATFTARGHAATDSYYSLQAMYYPSSFSGWTSLSLQNGWVAFDPVNYSPPQYTKSSDGVVTVRGLIKNGTTTSGTVIATLPAGYRPSASVIIPVDTNGAWGRIDIETDGTIVIRQVTSGGWIDMDPVTFIGEQ